ncbi:hypothetical protein CsSME_00014259 [Camellia sinensis var. sinensis]
MTISPPFTPLPWPPPSSPSHPPHTTTTIVFTIFVPFSDDDDMRCEGFKSVGFMVDLRCEGSSSAATTTEPTTNRSKNRLQLEPQLPN